MSCAEHRSWLAAKADGSLDADRVRLLDRHLADCDGCRRALADQMRVHDALAATPMVHPREGFSTRVHGRLAATPGWLELADFRVWTLRIAPVAAAVALLAMLWAGPRSGGTSSGPSSATFSPASLADWSRNVSPNALLEAALRQGPGDSHVR